ncbi:MAG: polyamine ABC transporter substrate-binding protein [Galactobacter sp.]
MIDDDVKVLGSRSTLNTLTRRSVLGGMAAAGVALLAACGQGSKKMASNIAPDGKLEDRVNMYSWGDYDDPALLRKFKQKFHAVVQADAFGSNEELMAKLSATRGTSGYDIVVPTSLYIPQMVEHELIQPLKKSLIPNFSTLDPAYLDQFFDPGNKYSAPKAYGSTGYVYDTTKIKQDLTSWADFIEAAKTVASGKVSLLEDAWEVAAIPLAVKGYDLNTTDRAQLAYAKKTVLNELAPHTRAYMGQAATAMAQGSFTLIHAYNGDARQGMMDAENPDRWKFVFPTEGGNWWGDNWCLATGAPHPDTSHKFIDWIIAPDQAKLECDYTGYATGSKTFLDPQVEKEFDYPEIVFPSPEVLERLTPSEFKGMEPRTDILTAAQAKSGA